MMGYQEADLMCQKAPAELSHTTILPSAMLRLFELKRTSTVHTNRPSERLLPLNQTSPAVMLQALCD